MDIRKDLQYEMLIHVLREYTDIPVFVILNFLSEGETQKLIKTLTKELYKMEEYKGEKNFTAEMCHVTYEFTKTFPFEENIVDEFPYASQAYLSEHGDKIKELSESYFLESSLEFTNMDMDMRKSFYKKIMCFMILSIQDGDEYTISIIKQLYKIGFRKEHNQLKKFSKMTLKDIMEFYSYPNYVNLARLIFMAHYIYKIEIEPQVVYLMESFKFYTEKIETADYSYPESFLFPKNEEIMDFINENRSYVVDTFRDNEEWLPFSTYFRLSSLCNTLFEHLRLKINLNDLLKSTYDENYVYLLTTAFAAIDYAFSDEMFDVYDSEEILEPDDEEMEILALILTVVECFISKEYQYNAFTDILLSLDADIEHKFIKDEPKQNKEIKKEKPIKEPKTNPVQNANNDKLIEELQQKYNKKVLEIKSKNSLLEQKNAEIRRLKEEKEEYNEMKQELQALREYVYHLTESEAAPVEFKEQNIDEYISDKNIVIIGGDGNWVKKLKSKYRNWTFIKPNASSNIQTSVIANADYVYFFTDCMKHGVYYRFMAFIRQYNIPFGYIHQVNIEKNEYQIYIDLKNKKKN